MFTKKNGFLKSVDVSYAESSIINRKTGLKRGNESQRGAPMNRICREGGTVKK